MNFLVDTNILSELIKPEANERVLAWIGQTPRENLYVSVISLGEIRKGIDMLPPSFRKKRFAAWLEQVLLPWFRQRILPVDFPVAQRWGSLLARCPRTLPAVDMLLAATALRHGLCVASRNTRDFHDVPDLPLVNPWRSNNP